MTFNSLNISGHIYFVTATICGWKPLFSHQSYSEIILGSLKWLRDKKRMLLFAYVLMPSHLHMLVKPLDRSISELIQNFGSFTAHSILKQLREDHCIELLDHFQQQRRDIRQKHSIWQDIQAKNVYSYPFLNQKLEYIHNNPVTKDTNRDWDRASYPYSSANYYDHEGMIPIPVDDIQDYT